MGVRFCHFATLESAKYNFQIKAAKAPPKAKAPASRDALWVG
jgi:hypothetical protein